MSLQRYPPLAGAPVVSAEDKHVLLHIVLVPAIGCNGDRTWFSGDDKHVPEMYCGITENVAFHRFHSLRQTLPCDEGLEPYAIEFLNSIYNKEELMEDGAPIHFACHSTGGLVLKRALLRSLEEAKAKGNAHNKKYAQLLKRNNISVAFFGVPHRGSIVLADRDLQGGISNLLGLRSHPSPTLLKQLEPGDIFLQEVHKQFLELIGPKFRKIWSFTEQLPTLLQSEDDPMPVANKMIVESSSAVLIEPGSPYTLANLNQRCVELQSTHDKLVDGRHMRMGINDYINDLRCLRDEAEFHVQIAEFERGTTSRGHKGFRSVPLHKLLSAGSGPDSGWYRPKDKEGKELLHWIHVSCNNMAWVADVLRAVSKATGSETDLTTVVLDEEVWKSREHRPHHRSPHARYMTPLFRAFLPEATPSHDARPKSVSFLPCPPKMSQIVLYMPYLHWDTSEFLTLRDRVIKCRSKIQFYQEEMSKAQAHLQNAGQELDWDELVPSPFPPSTTSASSEKKVKTNYIKSRMELEMEIEKFLKHQKSRRHQLLYNYSITSPSWDGALHPMRSLQQYGRPFIEEAYHRSCESEGEGEGENKEKGLGEKLKGELKKNLQGKRKDGNKKERKIRGGPDMLNHETGTEEIEPTYVRAFKAKQVKLAKVNAQAAKGTTANPVSGPEKPNEPGDKDEEPKEIPKVLMFDQLWIWAINRFVTFFPSNASEINGSLKTPGDLYDHICNKLTTHPRYPTSVYTVFDFMALIVLTSLSIMLDVSHRHRATSHYIDVFYVYESRINRSSWKDPETQKPSDKKGAKRSQDEELGSEGYTSLLGIKSELEILLQLLTEQLDVIESIKTAHPWIHKQTGKFLDPHTRGDHNENHHPFIETVEQRVFDYKSQMESLHRKCVSAIEMYTSLYDMIHTRKLVEEAESARRSSKMLMVFTVITVIFAPLTFLAGLFGVAAVEWDVKHQNLPL